MNFFDLFQNVTADEEQIFAALPLLLWHEQCERVVVERNGQVHSTCVIGDQVCIGDQTVIDPFVVIEEYVVIGKNCHIRSGALIRSHTVIGDNVVIGHGAEIKHAFIRDGAKVQGHTFAGDSIIGRGARIGTDTVLGNRRFDQKEISWQTASGAIPSGQDKLGALIGDFVRLGANVTTNPGTVIGEGTWVSGGQVLGGYIPPKMFIKANGEQVKNANAEPLSPVDKSGSV